MDIKILVADDDEILRNLLCDIIKKEGYTPIEARDGQEAIDIFFADNNINLVILDVMMPKYDGLEVLKEIRLHSEVPVIMLTALGDEKHEVSGLDNGADDYIAKPFSFSVLVARINTIIRKLSKDNETIMELGKLSIQPSIRKVKVNNEEIILNNKEFSLLFYLIKNKGMILEREKLLNNIWGYDFDGDIRTVDTHIKMLRSKLLTCNKYIKTVRGIGYMFEVVND